MKTGRDCGKLLWVNKGFCTTKKRKRFTIQKNSPMLEKSGEKKTNTYGIEGGKKRIGHENILREICWEQSSGV